jgi:hypothetical protein
MLINTHIPWTKDTQGLFIELRIPSARLIYRIQYHKRRICVKCRSRTGSIVTLGYFLDVPSAKNAILDNLCYFRDWKFLDDSEIPDWLVEYMPKKE